MNMTDAMTPGALPPRLARGMASSPHVAVCAYCGVPIEDVRNGGVSLTIWPTGSKLVLPGNSSQAETVFPFCGMPCAAHGVVEIGVASAIAAQG